MDGFIPRGGPKIISPQADGFIPRSELKIIRSTSGQVHPKGSSKIYKVHKWMRSSFKEYKSASGQRDDIKI